MKDIVKYSNKTLQCEDFEDGRLPTLDMNIRMEEGRVFNTFYEKGMSAKTVIHKDPALSENSKMASLNQNVVRHMRNIKERIDISERVEVVKFSQRMANSGYSEQQAKRVIISGLKGTRQLSRGR